MEQLHQKMNRCLRAYNIILTMLSIIFVLLSCDFQPNGVSFYVWEERDVSDGKMLMYKAPEPSDSDAISDSVWKRMSDIDILYLGKTLGNSREDFNHNQKCSPIFVHRFSGAVDTVYVGHHIGERNIIRTGYVSSYVKEGEWLVLECKIPGEINGDHYLANQEYRQSGKKTIFHAMWNYTYEGQERVFNSHITHYWIANRHTPDLYGPYTKNQLKRQLKSLSIPLPIKLNGLYDRYCHMFEPDSTVNRTRPKAFYFPHHRKRNGTLIE